MNRTVSHNKESFAYLPPSVNSAKVGKPCLNKECMEAVHIFFLSFFVVVVFSVFVLLFCFLSCLVKRAPSLRDIYQDPSMFCVLGQAMDM